MFRIYTALRKVNEWYAGDGWYNDLSRLVSDYYNSYVIHPMYVECMEELTKMGKANIDRAPKCDQKSAILREQRYESNTGKADITRRHIPGFRTFHHCQFATMQPLSMLSWRGWLPKN